MLRFRILISVACASASVGSAGCNVDLALDPDTQITCQNNGNCPAGFECDARSSMCVSTTENRAPTVAATLIGARSISEQQIDVVVRDANIDDTVSLAVSGRVEGGSWAPLTVRGLDTIENDLEATLVWDVAADAAAGSLPEAAVDLDGDETAESNVPAYTAVELRLLATDSQGQAGPELLVGPFYVGHSEPALSWSVLAPDYSQQVPLEVVLSDAAADPIALEVQFRVDRNDLWRTAAIVLGSIGAAPSAPDPGASSVIVWESDRPTDADATVPQGAGRASSNDLSVRMRTLETDGADTLYGPWQARTGLSLVNSSPPRIEDLRVARADSASGESPLAITFRLIDRQSDLVDMLFEYSFDRGQSWFRAAELPSMTSEGRYSLPSSPEHMGGIPHSFVWDATHVAGLGADLAQLRVRARDAFSPEETGTVVTLARPLGYGSDELSYDAYQTVCSYYMTAGDPCSISPQSTVSGDFNEDGHPDVAVSNGGGRVSVHVSYWAPPTGLWYVTTVHQIHSPRTLVTADLNGDGHLDLATVQENFNVSGNHEDVAILWGSATGTFSAGPQLESGPDATSITHAKDLTIGDFDGNRSNDIAALNADPRGVGVLLGTGGGAFAAAEQISMATSPTRLGSGDFDADGRDELVVGTGSLIRIMRYTTGSGWSEMTTVSFTEVGSSGLEVADMNQDGVPDFAGASANSKMGVLLSTGTLAWEELGPFPVGERVSNIKAGDLNRDGYTDLLASSSTSGLIHVYLGQGAPGAPLNGFLSAAAIPHDSVRDAVPLPVSTDDVARIFGAGTDPTTWSLTLPTNIVGSFAAPVEVTVGRSLDSLEAHDTDLNGAPDLLGWSEFDVGAQFANETDEDLGVGTGVGAVSQPEFGTVIGSRAGDLDRVRRRQSGRLDESRGPLRRDRPGDPTVGLGVPLPDSRG